ncbi:MAG: hypothetical protein KC561_19025, partial [Myxococcales bacterium]|nr:hypothetical protein [Myxococcales bacterium]
WEELEAIRISVNDPTAPAVCGGSQCTWNDYRAAATGPESVCLAAYLYNAAYINDTLFPERNWWGLSGERLELVDETDLPNCFPSTPFDPCTGPADCAAGYQCVDNMCVTNFLVNNNLLEDFMSQDVYADSCACNRLDRDFFDLCQFYNSNYCGTCPL